MFKSVREASAINPDMTVFVNGVEVPAWNGETVASVMLRIPNAGRTSPVSGSTRLPYCQMGVCFECLAIVDGNTSVQGCLVPVMPGMRVESQRGPREISK
ncbi:(2Fe-2S)-binding protein [Agrobacterium tumefaciens]|uniref:(2Fe-2S)-binding protein n=1 Tax=Agrobacterium tumefaciens TaxID=358 RepID=UPI001574B6C9|nr:(2Fe-2S)-binding protein [Agrobacterium tumefaciens]NSX84363.1 (2Fe-2S)-binding protein [Agrobacterium tumefaciens]NTA50002.1 (2Fe-2S)-binding protein [Agrobacterium tumefaciens]